MIRIAGFAAALPIAWLALLLTAVSAPAAAMECIECHADPSGGGFHGGFRPLSNLTRDQIDVVCLACHDGSYTNPDGVAAPEAAVHEQVYSGQGKAPEYGTFKVGCLDCHNTHGAFAGDGSQFKNLKLLGAIVREANSTDKVARIRKPVINFGADGTPGTDDDSHIGWECDSGTANDPACVTSDDGFGGTHVRMPVFYGDLYEGGAWTGNGGVNPWANDSAPYNGACNSCHTRTSHHRRDNSGGDHTHNIDKSGCVACHSHASGWLNKGG